jgi:integration host factor subunit beta
MAELVDQMAKDAKITMSEADKALKKKNASVTLAGFGTLKKVRRKARNPQIHEPLKIKEYESYNGRKPRTGEIINVKPQKLPGFRPGGELKARVDRKE